MSIVSGAENGENPPPDCGASDTLVRALAAGDIQTVIRRTARFNWDRDLILALVRQQGIASLLVRSLFREDFLFPGRARPGALCRPAPFA